MDETIISRAIVEGYIREFLDCLEVDVAAVNGLPRMGPIFGGMLLSGKKAAELAVEILKK